MRMAEAIIMPKLGESVTEGTVSRWLVRIGDKVNKYDPLCEVSTDKVTAEVPSILKGIVTEIVVPEGETVEAGTVICRIEAEDAASLLAASREDAPAPAHEKPAADEAAAQPVMDPVYSPAVMKLVREHGLDPKQLKGTGRFGRVTRNDVLELLEKGRSTEAIPSPRTAGAGSTASHGTEETIPVTAVRRAIARRMSLSTQEIPHAWTMIECDVTNLVKHRNAIKDEFRKTEGVALTYFPFFIKAVAEALREFPIINSQWAGDQIILKRDIHISIAVAADQALFAPVIRHADRKDIAQLAKAVHELTQKAREGRLTADDLSGGTFTVNNTGSFGSMLSAPIIHHPQAAIITFEAIVKRPAMVDRMLVELDKVNLCLSMDHRILDGWVCGRFLQSVRRKLESYGPDTRIYERDGLPGSRSGRTSAGTSR